MRVIVIDPVSGENVILSAEDEVIYQLSDEDNEQSSTAAEVIVQDSINTLAYPSTAPKCAIYSVYAYPMVRCKETGSRSWNTGIYARGLWPRLLDSNVSVHVSPADVANLNDRVLSYFESRDDGYTYSLVGWRVVSTYKFTSNGTIKYEAYSPQWDCFQGKNEVSKFVYSGSSLEIGYSFAVDPTVTSYSYCGNTGGFWPSGGVDIMIGGGVALNSHLA